jgi:hypothetical protein
MVALYDDIMNYLNRTDQEELKQSQRRWLKQRLDCDDEFLCTKQAYTERIDRLAIVLGRVSAHLPRSGSPSVYSVGGLAVGGKVHFDSKEYQKYDCNSSEQFDGFVWCHYETRDHERRGSYHVSYTILHSLDGTALYINRSQQPAYWNDNEVNDDIARYSKKIGGQPRIFKERSRSGNPDVTIALWGDVTLETLDNGSRAILAEGKSPKKGILVDTIANLTQSAREGLPIYRVDGRVGFVWIASNKDGRGTLRFLAIDPSRVYSPRIVRPAPAPTPAPTPTFTPSTPVVVVTGTGFFVAPNMVITNNHVVNECTKPIQVRYPERGSFTATIYGRDETNDLALLHTEMNNASVASFRIRPRLGERVAAYGFPYAGLLSSSGNFTLGNVTAETGMNDDTRFLQISTPIQPGNSGGPLLDMSGSIVGMVVAQLNATRMMELGTIPQNVNFAIRTPIITNFLSGKGITPNVSASGSGLVRELPEADVAEIAKRATVQVYCEGVKTSNIGIYGPESSGWSR